jgi:hypothetical protein
MQSNLRNLLVLVATTLAVEISSFGSVAPVEVAPVPPDAKLLELAKNHFSEGISPAEEKLFRAAANGEDADYSQEGGDGADPAKAAGWKTVRVIRSDRLRWLCTDPVASDLVSCRGISIIGAHIDGVLDLQWARIPYPLQMRRCAFTEKLILERSHLRSLNLQAAFVKELAAAGLNVDESVTMSEGFKAEGKVQIMDVTIGGNFECGAGQFIASEGIAFDARSVKIGGNVYLGQARFEGGVDFTGATISGNLVCDGGQFIKANGRALSLDSAKIDHNLFLRRANLEGEVWLYNATIGGNFECSDATFKGAEKGALAAISARIGSNVSLGQARFEGGVDFTGATISGNLMCDGGQFIKANGSALSLDSAKIDRNLFLRKANFQGEVWLYNATIGGNFECSGGTFTGTQDGALAAISAKIGSDVYLNASFAAKAKVAVTFREATIGGDLECSGGTFTGSETGAFDARSVKIGSNVSFGQARFKGAVNFNNATISGIFDGDGGQFVNGNAEALSLDSAKIDRNLFLRKANFQGEVWLYNATIGGNFECSDATFKGSEKGALTAISAQIGSNVSLRQARFEGAVNFNNATISGIFDGDGCQFVNGNARALSLDSAKIDHNLFLRRANLEGEVWLYNATIDGNFECSGTTFKGSETGALTAISARIGGHVLCTSYFQQKNEMHFRAEGAVVFNGATISGNFMCDGGQFIKANGSALSLDSAKIDRNLFLRKANFQGEVWLYNATIGGNFECSGGTFTGTQDGALTAISAKIGSNVYLNNGFATEGMVSFKNGRVGHNFVLEKIDRRDRFMLDLQFAKVGTLLNEEKSWPSENNLFLNGFAYDQIDSRASPSADIQNKWLRHQRQDQFLAQPYDQLAAALRNMGRQEEGVKVMIAKNEDHGRRADNFWDWCWYNGLGRLIGYGYRPWNALGVSLIVVGIGTLLFWRGFRYKILVPTDEKAYEAHKNGQLSESYPRFNPFIYSLETFVPLVKLGVDQYWIPNPNLGADVLGLLRKFAMRLPFGKCYAEHSQEQFALIKAGGLLRCYLWFHILLGWILTTLWVGGLTGLLKA